MKNTPNSGLPRWMDTKALLKEAASSPADLIHSGDGTECPHCNGYGSSFKDPEGTDTCSMCKGSGVVSKGFAGDYEGIYGPNDPTAMVQSGASSRRYYIERTSVFDNPAISYDIIAFSTAIESGGGENVGLSKKPGEKAPVLSFDASGDAIPSIKKELKKIPVFSKWGGTIRPQNWTG